MKGTLEISNIPRFIIFACVRAINVGWKKGQLSHDFKLICEVPFGIRLNCVMSLPFGLVGHFFVYFCKEEFKGTFPSMSLTLYRWE